MSVNFTVRIPRSLAERMKRFSEVNWSEVVRRSIEKYLEVLEEAKVRESRGELLERLKEFSVSLEDLEPLPAQIEEKLQKAVREAEWRRLDSTIQAR